MSQYPSVSEFMTKRLITFPMNMDIWRALRLLLKHRISGAPVINEKGELIGMLSEVDCLRLVLDGPYNEMPDCKGMVCDFMSRELTTIEPDKTILDAAEIFLYCGKKRLPVVESGKLIGQISRSDVLRAIRKTPPTLPSATDGRPRPERTLPDSK